MAAQARRLAPKGDTLRQLFLKSGNLCAFPECGALMMNVDGLFVGQLCHIEAAEEGGERFNPAMSDEDRRQASNLMLMCYPHHQETNDVAKFTVAKLRQMKHDHELRFSRPDRAILDKLVDWTRADVPKPATTLARINTVLNWDMSPEDLGPMAAELKAYISDFARVPLEVRRFLGAVALRVVRASGTGAVRSSPTGTYILVSDVRDALRLDEDVVYERIDQLGVYKLGDLSDLDTDSGEKPAIRLGDLRSGWHVWPEVAKFCEKTATSIEVFSADLDFSSMDG
jgi:hypothetical protein